MFREYLQEKNLIHPRFRCVLIDGWGSAFSYWDKDPTNPLCIITEIDPFIIQVSCSLKEHLNHLILYLDAILYDYCVVFGLKVRPQVSRVVFNNKIYDVNSLEILLKDLLKAATYPLTLSIYELEWHKLMHVGGSTNHSYLHFTYEKGRYTFDPRDNVSIFRK